MFVLLLWLQPTSGYYTRRYCPSLDVRGKKKRGREKKNRTLPTAAHWHTRQTSSDLCLDPTAWGRPAAPHTLVLAHTLAHQPAPGLSTTPAPCPDSANFPILLHPSASESSCCTTPHQHTNTPTQLHTPHPGCFRSSETSGKVPCTNRVRPPSRRSTTPHVPATLSPFWLQAYQGQPTLHSSRQRPVIHQNCPVAPRLIAAWVRGGSDSFILFRTATMNCGPPQNCAHRAHQP